MESVLGRYRNLIILVGVLFLQVLGLAVQVKRGPNAESTRLIRLWAVDLITPFERAVVRAQTGTSNLWHNYFFLRGVRAENRELKQQIEQMRLEQVRLNEDAAQAHRLQSLLAFKEQFVAKTVPAQVIGSGGSDLSNSIYIDKGSKDGIEPDMAVITAGGIVGKVLRVYPSTSLVLMINDQSSGVGALLEKSRLQGVLHGTPNGELMLERVMSDEQVSPGDTLLSSGGDQIFPKGLPVGTVSKVSPGREMFLNIKVKPAADLSRLEEVLVVIEKQDREPVSEHGVRVRAADVLATRLPSVPDKPATPPANSSTGSATAQGSAVAASGQAPAGVTPQTSAANKPVTGNSLTPAAAPPLALSGAVNQSGTRQSGVSQPGIKPSSAQKTVSADPSLTGASPNKAQNPASFSRVVNKPPQNTGASGTNGFINVLDTSSPTATPPSAASKPAAKPLPPKSTNPSSTPQPPSAEDNPH